LEQTTEAAMAGDLFGFCCNRNRQQHEAGTELRMFYCLTQLYHTKQVTGLHHTRSGCSELEGNLRAFGMLAAEKWNL